ncbi:MAG: PKD domain-containing protein, partial [Chloroflexaceae bacterium]|nr:PKD domain-containing protein [Chloroflexaceae bacterium]
RLLYPAGNRLGQSASRWYHAVRQGAAEWDLGTGISTGVSNETVVVDLQPTSTLTATLVGGTPISYTWDLGDSSPRTTTTVPTLTYEYATFGTYTVTVTVAFTTTRSSEVLTLTSQTLVDIPGIEIVADDVFFVEQPITLTSNLFNLTPISYTWDFGDGEGIIGSGEGITATNIVTHTYQNIGVYTVTVQAVTEQGEVSAQVQVNVIEQPLTSLTAANSSPSEALQATVFTATVTGARPSTVVSYTWDFWRLLTTAGDRRTTGHRTSHLYLQYAGYLYGNGDCGQRVYDPISDNPCHGHRCGNCGIVCNQQRPQYPGRSDGLLNNAGSRHQCAVYMGLWRRRDRQRPCAHPHLYRSRDLYSSCHGREQ